MVDEFDGDEYELRAVVDAAQTLPFLTERRVVVARDVGRFTADDVGPLVALARRSAAPPRSWCWSPVAGGCRRSSAMR